jgi:L-alanine-DL-glutamate epimerase-like enolase superfamily enzyme
MNNTKLSWYPYLLELRHPFTIAVNSRTTTPAVLVEIEYDGITGYGEASLPPYLPETQKSVHEFLGSVDLKRYNDITDIETILADVDLILPGNTAAKASIDIALHDLKGKILGVPVYKMLGIEKIEKFTSYTIGIDSTEMIIKKVDEAEKFRILKVKLGSKNDKRIIETIRSRTDKPIYVDINQGWSDREEALDLCHWLNQNNVVLIEQPFQKANLTDTEWLNARSPLPVIADEAVQRLEDLDRMSGVYSGINIKLMKCTGLMEGLKMINYAKKLNLKIMLGCMTETSCAISAAAQISSLADWVDLDGNILIKNDKFEGVKGIEGIIQSNDMPGIGIKKIV